MGGSGGDLGRADHATESTTFRQAARESRRLRRVARLPATRVAARAAGLPRRCSGGPLPAPCHSDRVQGGGVWSCSSNLRRQRVANRGCIQPRPLSRCIFGGGVGPTGRLLPPALSAGLVPRALAQRAGPLRGAPAPAEPGDVGLRSWRAVVAPPPAALHAVSFAGTWPAYVLAAVSLREPTRPTGERRRHTLSVRARWREAMVKGAASIPCGCCGKPHNGR